ncbi:hypothetical protein B0H16DRAFT_1717735 [Mycena metata]|uniref:Uncharacterized protein n=1 Tax=Mycena metata TaxID=1033252 RepID=A0AAD7JHV6_9AGAR|nr:hypothetical protein B0H16DRAFT_1717735 [Mycena metata]
MPRAGTAARRRAREGLPPAKPGKIHWVHGTKEVFFRCYKVDFLAAAEVNQPGAFYSRVGRLYLEKYGYHTAWEDDLEHEDDVAEDVDLDEDVNSLSVEEAEFRSDYFAKLRKKIGVWYNENYQTDLPTKRKKKKLTFTKLFDKTELDPPAPVKMRTLHFYSRNFYTERVVPRVATRWQALQHLPNPPKIITVRAMVTKEAWLAETQEFRDEVILALEKEHETALKAYTMAISGETPTTAEEFSVALNNAVYYIQPFADTIHDRFGMNVAVLLCGPIPDRGGRIEVRSVHSGTSNGMVPRIWSDFDRGGFDGAQRSFVNFSHHCFTEEECRVRALDKSAAPGAEQEEDSAGSDKAAGALSRQDVGTAPETVDPSASRGTAPVNVAAQAEVPLNPSTQIPVQIPTLMDDEYAEIIAAAGGEEAWAQLGSVSHFDLGIGGDDVFPSSAYMETGWGRDRQLPPTPSLVTVRDGDNLLASSAYARTGWGQHLEPPPTLLTPPTPPPTAASASASASASAGAGRGVDDAGRKAAAALPVGDADTGERTQNGGERPKPKPRHRGALKKVEEDTWRKLVADAVLERPETNTDAEGPLAAEVDEPRWTVAREDVAEGGEESGEEGGDHDEDEGMVWEEQDMSAWPEELQFAYSGFDRGQDWGGPEWKRCIVALIELERAWGFARKGLLSVPNGENERLAEVPEFMRYARKWDKPFALTSEIGPTAVEGSMAARWWDWWTRVQPECRMQESGKLKLAERVPLEEWEELGKMSGRNGVLLYVGVLLWWGEAAAETEAEKEREVLLKDWRYAVDDVAIVLELAAASTISAEKKKLTADKPKKRKADKPTAAKAAQAQTGKPKAARAKPKAKTGAGRAPSKRRQPDVPDKENEPAKKRARTRR